MRDCVTAAAADNQATRRGKAVGCLAYEAKEGVWREAELVVPEQDGRVERLIALLRLLRLEADLSGGRRLSCRQI